MNYRVLYRKYRPIDFDSIVGQDYTKTLLKNCIISNKISHAYIFTGPRGTGKTSTAKIFARAINCQNPQNGNPCNKCENCLNFNNNPDIIELDAASNNGVDEIREIIDNVRLAPSVSKYKVYIIDEVHMLSTSAFNALLLTLEEPPSNVVFILATTDIQSVPITILSRCQRLDFKLIDHAKIIERLQYVCANENIKIDEDALDEIATISHGGLRDALSILDQLSSANMEIHLADVISVFGGISQEKINKFINIYESGNIKDVLDNIENFKNDGIEASVLIEKLISAFKYILIKIKESKYNGNLIFDDIYNLVLSLNSILANLKYNINSYDMIQVILLKYIKYFPGNNEPKKKIEIESQKDNNKINKEESTIADKEKNLSINTNKEENHISRKFKFDINIRINNTFVNAKKENLNFIKSKWEDFIIYESNTNKKLLSYIADTVVVAASENYAILTNNIDSTNDLLNENIDVLEKDFNLFYNLNYKLVSISINRWNAEKEKYIKNIRSGFNYKLIDDNIVIEENLSELEKVAADIFGNNYEVK